MFNPYPDPARAALRRKAIDWMNAASLFVITYDIAVQTRSPEDAFGFARRIHPSYHQIPLHLRYRCLQAAQRRNTYRTSGFFKIEIITDRIRKEMSA